jgi:hypothetical protein
MATTMMIGPNISNKIKVVVPKKAMHPNSK